jgi:uncharacterized sporulation protein YeaH/YhbH (DUF444 family)
LTEFSRIQRERYPRDAWNIYVAQVSDGDNFSGDTKRAVEILEQDILPAVQYFAYVEVAASAAVFHGETDLWRGYKFLADRMPRLAMRRVADRRDIFPVFRDLFGRKAAD